MRTQLFTYGTLEFAEVMEAVVGRRLPAEPAVIDNHGRYAIKHRIYPGLRYQEGESTRGTLYREVDPSILAILDWFEDDGYVRRTLIVHTSSGERKTAEVYLIPPQRYALLSAAAWDPEDFRRRHLADYLHRCADYRREACRALGISV